MKCLTPKTSRLLSILFRVPGVLKKKKPKWLHEEQPTGDGCTASQMIWSCAVVSFSITEGFLPAQFSYLISIHQHCHSVPSKGWNGNKLLICPTFLFTILAFLQSLKVFCQNTGCVCCLWLHFFCLPFHIWTSNNLYNHIIYQALTISDSCSTAATIQNNQPLSIKMLIATKGFWCLL